MCVCVCACSVFVFVLVCITLCSFSVRNHIEEEDCFYCLTHCYCICSVACPHGAMGWSAVIDSGIS